MYKRIGCYILMFTILISLFTGCSKVITINNKYKTECTNEIKKAYSQVKDMDIFYLLGGQLDIHINCKKDIDEKIAKDIINKVEELLKNSDFQQDVLKKAKQKKIRSDIIIIFYDSSDKIKYKFINSDYINTPEKWELEK